VPEKERTVADPNATIDVEVALAALRRFSLLERRPGDPADSVGRIHRVVQLITREALDQTAQRTTLTAMLASVNEYTPTDCYDFRTWSVLEPLHLHLTVITALAEQANIAEPTSRLLSILGGFLEGKARYAEAEPLMRRALAIDEQSLGPDHPDVAIDLNNLAQLLQATNRLAEAEPLMRRALAIDEQSLWPDHPNVAIHLNNLALLLQATDRLAEAEP
jgi:tetratricopeptide (TPR) repeat protein